MSRTLSALAAGAFTVVAACGAPTPTAPYPEVDARPVPAPDPGNPATARPKKPKKPGIGLGPPPTGGEPELRGEADTERFSRKRWFEHIHRAAPGVDWRAIERRNGAAAVAQRSARVGLRAGPGAWVERGSDNLAGSMYGTVVGPDGRLYSGSALGGLWRGAPDGTGWEPLGDNLYGGAHFHAVRPHAGGVRITVATESGLVHVSDDDGRTWRVPDGIAEEVWAVRRLRTAADGTLWLVAAWGDYWSPSWRVLRSDDGGASFDRVLTLGDSAGDVAVSRTGGAEVWVVGASLHTSIDGGRSFDEAALPDRSNRADLAAHEGGRLWVVLGDDAALHRSDDGGATWVPLGTLPDYWGRVAASALDPDVLLYGGVEAHRSVDGGATFEIVNPWTAYYEDPETQLHADIMAIDVVPSGDTERWYIGTHGGVYQSDDAAASWTTLSGRGLRVSQYYDVSTSVEDPTQVVAGSQDQGWQHASSAPWRGGDRFRLNQLISGDYGHLSTADGSHAQIVGVYPGSTAVQLGATNPAVVFLEFPPDEIRSPWMPVVVADPSDPKSFFFLTDKVWRYRAADGWWKERVWSEPELADDQTYLSAMAFSPRDPDLVWAASSKGDVLRSDDRGETWRQMYGGGPEPQWLYSTALLPSARRRDLVFVGGSGYSGPSVLRSDDGGKDFRRWDQGLPTTTVYCLCEAPDGTGAIYAGTETGAWRRGLDDDAWLDITGVDAPITIYWSCESLHHEATVRFGTYGRGIWDYQTAPQEEGCFPAVDGDDDGYGCDVDCDDANPAVHPDAVDTCGGADADCDGADGQDLDGDGRRTCDDCDDADPSVYVGANDVCDDEVDQDCDGEDAPCNPKKCGCDGAGASPPAALALLVAARRRRRSAALVPSVPR